MVVILKRAAASLVVGASLFLSGSNSQAQVYDAITEPLRNAFQQDRYSASEMQRARDEVRLNKQRVELERKTQLLAREYIEYNANVTAYLNYNFTRQPNTSLFLPVPAGLIDPNATGLFIPSECYPSSSVSTAGNNNPNPNAQPPAYQPGGTGIYNPSYAPSEPVAYPPVPTPATQPQPTGNYYPGSRDLQWNNGVPYQAQQPLWRP